MKQTMHRGGYTCCQNGNGGGPQAAAAAGAIPTYLLIVVIDLVAVGTRRRGGRLGLGAVRGHRLARRLHLLLAAERGLLLTLDLILVVLVARAVDRVAIARLGPRGLHLLFHGRAVGALDLPILRRLRLARDRGRRIGLLGILGLAIGARRSDERQHSESSSNECELTHVRGTSLSVIRLAFAARVPEPGHDRHQSHLFFARDVDSPAGRSTTWCNR